MIVASWQPIGCQWGHARNPEVTSCRKGDPGLKGVPGPPAPPREKKEVWLFPRHQERKLQERAKWLRRGRKMVW